MRSGKYSMLEMMSPTPCACLDEVMSRALTLASHMEFETLELEVWFTLLHPFDARGFVLDGCFFFSRASSGNTIRWRSNVCLI